MAATRVRFVLSVCRRLSTGLRCNANTRRLILDSSKLVKQCSVNFAQDIQASCSTKRFLSGQYSTTSALCAAGVNTSQVTESPESRPSSAGGGAFTVETEDDDDPFMKEMVRRYEICRRWLASIMGEDIENFTEEDMKEAIEYLMPTGLYAKDARPLLLHPKKLFTKRKAQIFDTTGRPFAAAFYTGQVAYHNLIFDIYRQFEKLEHNRLNVAYEQQQSVLREENKEPEEQALGTDTQQHDLNEEQDSQDSKSNGSPIIMRWIKKPELENILEETLSDKEYEVVIHRLKKLSNQPDVHLVQEFLNRFLLPVPTPGVISVSLQLDDQGRAHGMGYRKRSIAEVWVKEGSGLITVNGHPFVQYFCRTEDRQQVMFPFQVVDGIGQYDAECNVIGGGSTGQAGAIRLAISCALLNFSADFLDPLQEAGLLIRDTRIVERKKPGQKKARKKFTWVKR